jgi:hypothetical protein
MKIAAVGHNKPRSKKGDCMPQTVCWSDITERVCQLPSLLHDRVVTIMLSLDRRYSGLGMIRAEPTDRNRSQLTEWIKKGPGGHKVSVIGGTYAEEDAGPLRRVFAVIYDADPLTKGWTNMRVELLGIDHEYPEHRDPKQWNAANFQAWSRDFRHALLALGKSGDPRTPPPNPPAIRLRAYIPPRMQWEPMKAFHDFIFSELEHGQGGRLIDPSSAQVSTDWVDYEFVLDRL